MRVFTAAALFLVLGCKSDPSECAKCEETPVDGGDLDGGDARISDAGQGEDSGADAGDAGACGMSCAMPCRCSKHLECVASGASYECLGECPPGYEEYGGGPRGDEYERFCKLVDISVEVTTEDSTPIPTANFKWNAYVAEVEASTTQVSVTVTVPDTVSIEIDGEQVESGAASKLIDLRRGTTVIDIILSDVVQGTTAASASVLVQRGVDLTYIKASNAEEDDRFGGAVAIDGDTLAVAAHSEASGATEVDGDQDDNSAPQRGAAYVFRHDGVQWSQEAYLKVPDTREINFSHLALSGNRLAAGGQQGVAMFERVGTSWSFDERIPTCYDKPRLAGDTLAIVCGYTIEVYRRGASGWILEATLSEAEGFEFDGVGLGGNTLVASGFREVGREFGEIEFRTFVFERSGDLWQLSESLCVDPNECSGEILVSPDGMRMAIRAGYTDEKYNGEFVYILSRQESGWIQEAAIPEDLPDFGDAMALTNERLLIRAVRLAGDWFHVYEPDGETWTRKRIFKYPGFDSDGNELGISDRFFVVGSYADSSSAKGIGGDPTDELSPKSGAAVVVGFP